MLFRSRLDVAVDDACGVGGIQRLGDLNSERQQRTQPEARDGDADEHVVLREEGGPLVVDQRAIGLDRVLDDLVGTSQLLHELDHLAGKLYIEASVDEVSTAAVVVTPLTVTGSVSAPKNWSMTPAC